MDIGKVYKYDGIVGEIITDKGKYFFTYNGVEEDIKEGDMVTFKVRDSKYNVVTDIRVYNGKNLTTLLREYKDNNK